MTNPRILSLVDAQNLYYTPKTIWGAKAKIDFQKLYQLIAKRKEAQVNFYMVADPIIDQSSFIRLLTHIGYTTKIKTLYEENGEYKNTNWDEEIIKDGENLIDEFDELVMVSGDGDFIPLLEKYRRRRKKVSVICFRQDFCPHLKDYADRLIFLDKTITLTPKINPVKPSYPRPNAFRGCRFPMS